MQKGFIFDLNKCTGCNACQIACSLENEVSLPLNWRQVITYNKPRHPDIPFFHLSIACNHCIDPPCMKYCPALAYFKNERTGAVVIDPDKCIGCQYCSWVCPYDAPQYNPSKRLMEKCTLCDHRLEENLMPACVALCPTTALQYDDYEVNSPMESVPGFTTSNIKPVITFIPLDEKQPMPEISDLPFDENLVTSFRKTLTKIPIRQKIYCFQEWPLVLFTLLIPFLFGNIISRLLTTQWIPELIIIILGIIGFGISTFHLGKKLKAVRAILNWKKSWLSREILFYSIFFILFILYLLFFKNISWIGWLAGVAGFLTLQSVNKVYEVIPIFNQQKYHSADTLLTGLFFAAIFSEYTPGILIFGGIKALLYLQRMIRGLKQNINITLIRGSIRIILGFLLPILLWLLDIPDYQIFAVISVFLAELIDRCEFYNDIDIITPQKQMQRDLDMALL